MASEEVLRRTLHNADGKPFAKYANIKGAFATEQFELIVDEVQGDRAGRSRMRVRVPMAKAGFPEGLRSGESRTTALRDMIARRFWESSRTHARSPIAGFEGGQVRMPRPGQEVIPRGCVQVTDFYVEACFSAALPSKGNKVSEEAALELIFGRIALIASESMFMSAYKSQKAQAFVEAAENADWIRAHLAESGLAAFVAVGSVLPRREDGLAPMIDAEPFDCDGPLKVEMRVPNGPPVVGMGVPAGYTAVTGPTGSGKSSLADAVFAGVYNHIPGDGREYVVSDPDASLIVNEAGRLLGGRALSGPESGHAAVTEAVEAGSRLLVVDEDRCSPALVRRAFMSRGGGPALCELGHSMGEKGVSLLMVTGDERAVRMADTAIAMEGFRACRLEVGRLEGGAEFEVPPERRPVARNVDFSKGRKEVSTAAPSLREVEVGELTVGVPAAGFLDQCQTREAADAVAAAREIMDGSLTLREACERALEKVESADAADGTGMAHARARAVDVAAVLCRHPAMLFIERRRRRLLFP